MKSPPPHTGRLSSSVTFGGRALMPCLLTPNHMTAFTLKSSLSRLESHKVTEAAAASSQGEERLRVVKSWNS